MTIGRLRVLILVACLLPVIPLASVDTLFYVDWINHLWLSEYFGAYFRSHLSFPLIVNTNTEVGLPHETLLIKVDAQGFKLPIVKGAHGIIDRLELIQLEASFRPVYRDEPPIEDLISYMRKVDFRIVSIDPGWEDQSTHELLQVDLLFSR
jgi:hypothetical protein